MEPAAQPATCHTKAGDVLYSARREIGADSPMSLGCRMLAGVDTRTPSVLHTIPTNLTHNPEIKSPLSYVNIVSNKETLLCLERDLSSTRPGVSSEHDYHNRPPTFKENKVQTISSTPPGLPRASNSDMRPLTKQRQSNHGRTIVAKGKHLAAPPEKMTTEATKPNLRGGTSAAKAATPKLRY